MSSKLKPTAFIPTVKREDSQSFYQRTLGLKLIYDDDYALEFESDEASLRVTVVDEFVPHPFTVLGFKVEEIVSEVKSLIEEGVIFERYDSLDQDHLGIWISPSKAKIAWFKDPDGNLLSLTQYP